MTTAAVPAGHRRLYSPAGFFLLRAPILPVAVYHELTRDDPGAAAPGEVDLAERLARMWSATRARLDRLMTEPAVRLAVAVASPDLLDAMDRAAQSGTSARQRERLHAGLLRYLIRMSTRATPFGCFAGVAMGGLATTGTVRLAADPVRRTRTRPDMRWLMALVEQLERSPELVPHLPVVANPSLYRSGEQIIAPYTDVYGALSNDARTMRATPAVQLVLDLAARPIRYRDLRARIHAAFPEHPVERVDGMLRELWDHHVLVGDLRPPLTGRPAELLADRLREQPATRPVAARIEQVLEHARQVDAAPAGTAVTRLRQLAAAQRSLLPDAPVQLHQVDTQLRLAGDGLRHEVAAEAAEAAEVLLRIGGSPTGLPYLDEYRHGFLERFGSHARVPLLDLLSPENGLDAPPGYPGSPREYPLWPVLPDDRQQTDRVLSRLLIEAVHRHEREITLTEPVIRQLERWAPDRRTAPALLDVHLQIAAAPGSTLDRGDWRAVLGIQPLAYGGRTFGRFLDLLGPAAVDQLRDYVRQQERLEPGAVYAGVNYLPTHGRMANVMGHPPLWSYEIPFNTAPSVPADRVIPLSDLVVSVEHNRFVVRSVRLGRRVVACQGHMANQDSQPGICRFLLDIAADGQPFPRSFSWGAFETAPFLPRVSYRRIVLRRARWNLRPDDLPGRHADDAAFFTGVQEWRRRWQVPRHVHLTWLDQTLLIDLEHPAALAELRAELQKCTGDQVLVLAEMLPGFGQLPVTDATGRPHVTEFVVPLILDREPDLEPVPEPVPAQPVHRAGGRGPQRRQLPGGPWTYVKLYTSERQQPEIIRGALREFTGWAATEQLTDRWFFIRYQDPEPHLRVRLHAPDPDRAEALLWSTLDWGGDLAQRGWIRRLCLDTYEPEVERYGGPSGMEQCEHLFCVDSQFTAELIAARYDGRLDATDAVLGATSLDRALTCWEPELAGRLWHARALAAGHDARKAFRPYRRTVSDLLMRPHPRPGAEVRRHGDLLDQLVAAQAGRARRAVDRLRMLAATGQLWRTTDEIIRDMAHTHLNRLLGPDRGRDRNIYAFWRLGLEAVRHRMRAQEDRTAAPGPS